MVCNSTAVQDKFSAVNIHGLWSHYGKRTFQVVHLPAITDAVKRRSNFFHPPKNFQRVLRAAKFFHAFSRHKFCGEYNIITFVPMLTVPPWSTSLNCGLRRVWHGRLVSNNPDTEANK